MVIVFFAAPRTI